MRHVAWKSPKSLRSFQFSWIVATIYLIKYMWYVRIAKHLFLFACCLVAHINLLRYCMGKWKTGSTWQHWCQVFVQSNHNNYSHPENDDCDHVKLFLSNADNYSIFVSSVTLNRERNENRRRISVKIITSATLRH